MVRFSILHPDPRTFEPSGEPPSFLEDLHLDQVLEAMIHPGREEHLLPFFYSPLQKEEEVLYRQEVMKELEREDLRSCIKAFTEKMETLHRYLALAEKLDYPHHREGWFLEGVLCYCETLRHLARDLETQKVESKGLLALGEFLSEYLSSPGFKELEKEAREVKEALSQVRYCLIVQEGKFKVKRYEGEADYSREVEKTFEKFKQQDSQGPKVEAPRRTGTSHIEAKILEFIARLYPRPFALLEDFCKRHRSFLDETILSLDREIRFYLAYLDFMEGLKEKGLPFCYPRVSSTSKEEAVEGSFDVALALASPRPPVLNGYSLSGKERVLVVTGPNQGGKTTFARMFGQLHYLASLGLPVPGRKARLFLGDGIFTHFQKEEKILDLRGRLEDDLLRIHSILSQATSRSIFVINEIFSSTTLQDALILSKEILSEILELDALGLWVTFVEEISSMDERIVSMVAAVSAQDPTLRTFKIVRRPADGRAYALSLARKHGLTYQEVKERIK